MENNDGILNVFLEQKRKAAKAYQEQCKVDRDNGALADFDFSKGADWAYRHLKYHPVQGEDWQEVRPDNLPEIDEFVLWVTETGNYFFRGIDKDDYAWWNGEGPTGMHGIRCTHWKRIVGPGESKKEQKADKCFILLEELKSCDTLSPYFIGKIDELLKLEK